jgi:methylmalonyl-CoA mutase
VADPVAGSGGFEALTQALAEAAWTAFQEIEREGGIPASLKAGNLQRRIAEIRARREAAVVTRREPLTGTSEFPEIREAPVTVLMPASPAGLRASVTEFEPLPSSRLAEPFERLRETSDQRLADTGSRPKVFLANLGPVAAFSARATFAKNFFEAGGIEAISNDGFTAESQMAEAFRTSGARLACLCSSDEVYAREAVSAAEALRKAGAGEIYVAGRLGELEAPLAAIGVTRSIFAGCDAVAVLRDAARAG